MAIERSIFLPCVFLFLFLIPSGIFAEENYFFEFDESGAARFTQVISWDPVEYVKKYRLEILDASGSTVFDDTSGTTERTVPLVAGEYRYRITIYNLLDKPELTSDWTDLSVHKAELPKIDSINPRILYLDRGDLSFLIRGSNLSPDATVKILDPETGEEVFELSVRDSSVEGMLDVGLPPDILDAGEYRVRVANPGGLFADDESLFRIKGRSPYSLWVSAGWNPWVPLYDSWYTGIWDDGIYLPGAVAHLSWTFAAKNELEFGVRGTASVHVFEVVENGFDILTDYRRFEAAFFCGYRITPSLSAVGGLGAGTLWTYVLIEDELRPSQESASIDPTFNGFLEAQYRFNRHLFASLGVEFINVMYSGKSAGVLLPEISAGWRF